MAFSATSQMADNGRYPVSKCNTKNIGFSFSQMIAHHTVGGCPLRPGDLLATGTVSGPTRNELGCLLELSWGGRDPLELEAEEGSGATTQIRRTFLQDGDLIEFSAHAAGGSGDGRVGFGLCSGRIGPA
jgi:fumarylacetoacetase